MGNTTLSHGGGARDRFQKTEMAGVKREMNSKLAGLELQQFELMEKLSVKFDDDTFRKLNIVNQHLEVAESRAKGEWIRGNFLQITKAI